MTSSVSVDRNQLEQLAEVWEWAAHVAGSAATVVVVIPALTEASDRELDQFDAGQAVMAMMVEASDLGSAAGTHRWPIRPGLGPSSGCPRTGSAPAWWPSATRPTGRWRR